MTGPITLSPHDAHALLVVITEQLEDRRHGHTCGGVERLRYLRDYLQAALDDSEATATRYDDWNAYEAAVLLTIEGRFPVARVSGDYIFLTIPGSAPSAAEQLRMAGVDARATIEGQWCIRVTHGRTRGANC